MTTTGPAADRQSLPLMVREAAEAPEAVARQLAANQALSTELAERLRRRPPRFVVACARGSSDAAVTFAKYLIEIRLGIVVASVGPSVSSVYRSRLKLADALFLAVSQSGRSPDLLDLTAAARDGGAFTVALVNDAGSPLAGLSHLTLPLHAGPERSVAATKSYIASLAAILDLFARWSGEAGLLDAVRRLPEDLAAARDLDWSSALDLLAGAGDLFTIGRGPGFAIAQEAALKLKETCGIHAEAYSSAELMHGPLALARPGMPALVFSQEDESRPGVSALAATLAAKGMPVAAAGLAEATVALPVVPGVHGACAPVAMIQSFYRLAGAVARARGLDPDHPPHLRKVTETR